MKRILDILDLRIVLVDHLLKTKKNTKIQRNMKFKICYQNEIDKACFQHDMDYGDFKDSPTRTASDKVIHDKVFNIVKYTKCHGCQRGLSSMVYKFFARKSNLVVLLKVKLCQTKN